MLAVSTPETINPCPTPAKRRRALPLHRHALGGLYFGRGAKPGQPSPFKWTYHFGFGVGEFHKTYVSQWNRSRPTRRSA